MNRQARYGPTRNSPAPCSISMFGFYATPCRTSAYVYKFLYPRGALCSRLCLSAAIRSTTLPRRSGAGGATGYLLTFNCSRSYKESLAIMPRFPVIYDDPQLTRLAASGPVCRRSSFKAPHRPHGTPHARFLGQEIMNSRGSGTAVSRLHSDKTLIRVEKKLERIRHEIVASDTHHRRLLKSIELAIEQITTHASVADLAKRHNLTEAKVRRSIENAIFMARTRMYVKKSRNTMRSRRTK